MTTASAAAGTEMEERAAIIDLMLGASIEMAARDLAAIDACREMLPSGTSVYIPALPGSTAHEMVAAAARLRHAGFNPVPHVAARQIAGVTELDDYLARAQGEAGVDQALVIGGDVARPIGPYNASLQILETGLFEKHGFREIGMAGYPEPHPKIITANLEQALVAKITRVRGAGMRPYVVTQFCFDAQPITQWLRLRRGDGGDVPIRVGLAGPASVATLAKFALRCGIGKSIRALVGGQTSLARLLVDAGPEQIMRSLAARAGEIQRIAALHFFSFGGGARTAQWMRAIAAGNFILMPAEPGFAVDPRASPKS